MKKILITGKGSYIGTNFKEFMNQYSDQYLVDELDMMNSTWREFDFSKYDVVFHVAGIAHVKETKKNRDLYYKINRDLAYNVAKKAKNEGVGQFIFMSSMSVYGMESNQTALTLKTKCIPITYYGKSKLEAEQLINKLQTLTFKICILRPPMVYGEGAPGNLTKLIKVIKKVKVFPTIENKRSSISVNNLIKTIKEYIDKEKYGTYLPQDENYLCTVNMVKAQMEKEGVKITYTSIFNGVLKLLIGKVSVVTKCFGDLYYEK